MSLSGKQGVAQLKKSVKMGHPNAQSFFKKCVFFVKKKYFFGVIKGFFWSKKVLILG